MNYFIDLAPLSNKKRFSMKRLIHPEEDERTADKSDIFFVSNVYNHMPNGVRKKVAIYRPRSTDGVNSVIQK